MGLNGAVEKLLHDEVAAKHHRNEVAFPTQQGQVALATSLGLLEEMCDVGRELRQDSTLPRNGE